MTTAYSAFFASGLLAPPHTPDASHNARYDPLEDYAAPDSDIEIDDDREITPTPQNHPLSSTNQQRPRLRKRRSSVTLASSPMNAIRSPTRNAGAAFQLQIRRPNSSRSRSRSSGRAAPPDNHAANNITLIGNTVNTNATDGTSIVGRMRSSSIGGMSRPRRGVRRLAAPAAPPPTVPLPAVPTAGPPLRNRSAEALPSPSAAIAVRGGFNRRRSFSVGGALAIRIDEEIKE